MNSSMEKQSSPRGVRLALGTSRPAQLRRIAGTIKEDTMRLWSSSLAVLVCAGAIALAAQAQNPPAQPPSSQQQQPPATSAPQTPSASAQSTAKSVTLS